MNLTPREFKRFEAAKNIPLTFVYELFRNSINLPRKKYETNPRKILKKLFLFFCFHAFFLHFQASHGLKPIKILFTSLKL